MKFKAETKPGYAIIHCGDHLDARNAKEAAKVLNDIVVGLNADSPPVFLDLGGKWEIDQAFLREAATAIKVLRALKRVVHVVHAPNEAAKAIKELGMDGVFRVTGAIEDVLKGTPAKKAAFDVGFINPFIEGTIETLKIQCQTQVKAGKPVVRQDGQTSETSVDISGVIGLTSNAFNGSIAICFPERTFLAVMGRMLSENYTSITKDLEDGAGELLNIIFGFAKRILSDKGYSIEKAIPTVVRGKSLQIHHFTRTPTILLPFESDAGDFHIEIGIESSLNAH